jgi:hypothetical protein
MTIQGQQGCLRLYRPRRGFGRLARRDRGLSRFSWPPMGQWSSIMRKRIINTLICTSVLCLACSGPALADEMVQLPVAVHQVLRS